MSGLDTDLDRVTCPGGLRTLTGNSQHLPLLLMLFFHIICETPGRLLQEPEGSGVEKAFSEEYLLPEMVARML